MRDRALVAQPFDETRLELSGTPTVIGSDLEVGGLRLAASFSVSTTGTLVYRTAAAVIRTQLASLIAKEPGLATCQTWRMT